MEFSIKERYFLLKFSNSSIFEPLFWCLIHLNRNILFVGAIKYFYRFANIDIFYHVIDCSVWALAHYHSSNRVDSFIHYLAPSLLHKEKNKYYDDSKISFGLHIHIIYEWICVCSALGGVWIIYLCFCCCFYYLFICSVHCSFHVFLF